MERHELDPIALLAGVVFTGLGLLFLAGRFDALGVGGFRWLWPSLLVLLGLATLLGTLGRGRGDASSEPEVPPAAYHDPLPLELPELDLTDTSALFKIPSWEEAKAQTAMAPGAAPGTAPADAAPEGEAPQPQVDPEAETRPQRAEGGREPTAGQEAPRPPAAQ
jgi:hypothetical protein